MIDNPNTRPVNLKHRKTLPGPLSSIRTPNSPSKINRLRRTATTRTHSPPSSNTRLKNNPYIGWFRHAPKQKRSYSECMRIQQAKEICQLMKLDLEQSRYSILRGGSPVETPSFSFPTKFTYWLLDIPVITEAPDFVESDEELSSSHQEQQQQQRNSTISTQQNQRAYHYQELDDDTNDENKRLDYEISQMDVLRMHKRASKHLAVESIAQLPIVVYESPTDRKSCLDATAAGESWVCIDKEPELQEGRDVCVVCLEPFTDGQKLRQLPCGHHFHLGCIDVWLSGSSSCENCYTTGCPTCKQKVTEHPDWAFAEVGQCL